MSRHLRVLREAGLVVDTAEGRERVYRLDVAPLAEVDAWLAPFRDRLGAPGSTRSTPRSTAPAATAAPPAGRPHDPDAEERTA